MRLLALLAASPFSWVTMRYARRVVESGERDLELELLPVWPRETKRNHMARRLNRVRLEYANEMQATDDLMKALAGGEYDG